MRWVRPLSILRHSVVGNDARQQIVGEYTLGAFVVAVDREGDALVQEREVGGLLALAQFLRREFEQGLEQSLIVRPRRTRRREHLIVGRVKLVISKRRTKQRERLRRVHPAHKSASSGTARLHP